MITGQPQFLVYCLGKLPDAAFGGRVTGVIGKRIDTFDRAYIDQRPEALFSKQVNRAMAAVDKTFKINVYNGCLLCNRDFPERPMLPTPAMLIHT